MASFFTKWDRNTVKNLTVGIKESTGKHYYFLIYDVNRTINAL